LRTGQNQNEPVPDILARIFVIFMLVLYAGISLVFVFIGIRNWIWRPIKRMLTAGHPDKSYRGIKSASREENPS
jgi:hypothetical protein